MIQRALYREAPYVIFKKNAHAGKPSQPMRRQEILVVGKFVDRLRAEYVQVLNHAELLHDGNSTIALVTQVPAVADIGFG